MNIEHWTLTNNLLTINGTTSLLKTRAKVTELLWPWPNFLFFSVNSTKDPWVMMKAVAQQLMFFLPARTQSTSDPHLEPVFWPLGGLFCPAWLLGGLLLVFGLFPLGLLRRPSVLGTFWEFENLGSFSGQFYQFSFLFPPLGLPVCAGHLRSRFFSQTSRQLILTARHQSFQNFDFLCFVFFNLKLNVSGFGGQIQICNETVLIFFSTWRGDLSRPIEIFDV